jgi:asparagine synthase (glutamine-hydrolysing)
MASTPDFNEPFLRLQERNGMLVHDGMACFFRGLQRHSSANRDLPFFEWRWDGHTLAIENDRYGFYPLFYYAAKDEFVISPSLLTLLRNGAPSLIDWPAMAVFLRLSSFVGEDTPFRHIKLVPPNARVRRDGNRFRIEGKRPTIVPDWGLTRDCAIEGFIDLFREAIASMPSDGEAIVPLSGGRDSRHILLELCRQRATGVSALTIQHEPFIETEDGPIAQELTRRSGASHVTVRVPNRTVFLERQKNRLTHLATVEHRWILAAARRALRQDGTIYEGVAGDTLSAALWFRPDRLRLLDQGDLTSLALTYMDFEGFLTKALTLEALRECTLELAQQRVAEELQNHLEAAHPLVSFHFWNRTRRVTGLAPCCIWNQERSVWCPYLYHRLFDFLVSIPASLFSYAEYQRFHTDVILRAYPNFSDIPFGGKYRVARPWRRFNWNAAQQSARYELRFPEGTLLRSSFLVPRILRALTDPSYFNFVSDVLPMAIYLRQIEYCMAGRFQHV